MYRYQIRNKTTLLMFLGKLQRISHGYRTNFSKMNYKIPKTKLNKSKLPVFDLKYFSVKFGREIVSLSLFKLKLDLELKRFSPLHTLKIF